MNLVIKENIKYTKFKYTISLLDPRFPFFLSIFSLLKKIKMMFETVEQQKRQNKQTNKQRQNTANLKFTNFPKIPEKKQNASVFCTFVKEKSEETCGYLL